MGERWCSSRENLAGMWFILPPMPEPPPLTADQRRAALAKAAAARQARAELKERLKAGGLSLAQLFDMAPTDEVVAKTKVLTILESLPGVGKVTARRTMEELSIAESRRVQGVGDKQRAKLLEKFPATG